MAPPLYIALPIMQSIFILKKPGTAEERMTNMMKETATTEQRKKPFPDRHSMIEEYLCPVIEQLAVSCAEQFHDIAVEMGKDQATDMILRLKVLQEKRSNKTAVRLMEFIFSSAGKDCAVEKLKLLHACAQENETIYELFMDSFLETEEIDWYMMERLFVETGYGGTKQKKGGNHELM